MGGGGTPGVRAKEGVDKGGTRMNSYQFARNYYELGANCDQFMPIDRLQACRILPIFVLCDVWAYWMRLGGGDFPLMMGNEAWS